MYISRLNIHYEFSCIFLVACWTLVSLCWRLSWGIHCTTKVTSVVLPHKGPCTLSEALPLVVWRVADGLQCYCFALSEIIWWPQPLLESRVGTFKVGFKHSLFFLSCLKTINLVTSEISDHIFHTCAMVKKCRNRGHYINVLTSLILW